MIEALPDYVNVERWETGASFSLPFGTYRRLCATALTVIEGVPDSFMGIYRLPGEAGCALDIWTSDRCLTVQIIPKVKQLALFLYSDLDSSLESMCILSVSNSDEDWRRLGRMARTEILK
jgi:hypothetical protein